MRTVDYNAVAPAYNRRYETHQFDDLSATIRQFISDLNPERIVEIGCGTGHWLTLVAQHAQTCIGVDPSVEMLARAQESVPRALLVRGRAEQLPLTTGAADRVLCVNAIHHFTDRHEFSQEARRVLRSGGAVLIVGLDPHSGTDQWWVYDYFPGAREADKRRYPSVHEIQRLLADVGFSDIVTTVAQHIPGSVPFKVASERGLIDRRSTSQLMVIDDAEYAIGMARLHDEQPILTADLRLFATVGWLR